MAYKCTVCKFLISNELQEIRENADYATSDRCVNIRCYGTVIPSGPPPREKEYTICYSCCRAFDTDPTAQVTGKVIDDPKGHPWWICAECMKLPKKLWEKGGRE